MRVHAKSLYQLEHEAAEAALTGESCRSSFDSGARIDRGGSLMQRIVRAVFTRTGAGVETRLSQAEFVHDFHTPTPPGDSRVLYLAGGYLNVMKGFRGSNPPRL
jgi:hypothetical protein